MRKVHIKLIICLITILVIVASIGSYEVWRDGRVNIRFRPTASTHVVEPIVIQSETIHEISKAGKPPSLETVMMFEGVPFDALAEAYPLGISRGRMQLLCGTGTHADEINGDGVVIKVYVKDGLLINAELKGRLITTTSQPSR